MSEANRDRKKGIHEPFTRFFESPTRSGLRDLLKENVGEFDYLDFKAEWPEDSKLARHILALANSGGGILVIGVAEEEGGALSPNGLAVLRDKTPVSAALKPFLPDALTYEIYDFAYQDAEYKSLVGKKYQVVLVEDEPDRLPFVCLKNGDGIRAAAIYARDDKASVEASYTTLQKILNRRIETGRSTEAELTLRDHLDELRTLYEAIPKQVSRRLYEMMASLASVMTEPNPWYPRESYDAFIGRAIEGKKSAIEAFLNRRR